MTNIGGTAADEALKKLAAELYEGFSGETVAIIPRGR